jgi:hypothetical protein
MSDHEEIRNLIGRYAHYGDDWDFDSQTALFTTDAVLVEGGFEIAVHGPYQEIVRANVDAMLEKPQPTGYKHIQANIVIEVVGDRATAVSDLLSLRLSPDQGWTIGTGRYNDEIARVDGQWLFRRRVVTYYRNLGPDTSTTSGQSRMKVLLERDEAKKGGAPLAPEKPRVEVAS